MAPWPLDAPWPMNPIGNSTDFPTPGVVFLQRCPGLRRARLRDSGPGRHAAEGVRFLQARELEAVQHWRSLPTQNLRLHVEK